MTTRSPAVAGRFYTADKTDLHSDVADYLKSDAPVQRAEGIMVPHAGYMFSGRCAGKVYSQIEIPDTVLILGPNHTGVGSEFSMYPEGTWQTPLGSVSINRCFNKLLVKHCPNLLEDTSAHEQEHALEVQVPFLQSLKPTIELSAIVIWTHSLPLLQAFGTGIGRAIQEYGKDVLIIASSDMNHFESDPISRRKDQLAIDQILAMDSVGLAKTIQENKISMCGWAATVALMNAVSSTCSATLIDYCNSGETSGDLDSVVGYAGMIFR